jgi:hypothetical protein
VTEEIQFVEQQIHDEDVPQYPEIELPEEYFKMVSVLNSFNKFSESEIAGADAEYNCRSWKRQLEPENSSNVRIVERTIC